jgi:hypothetical protein
MFRHSRKKDLIAIINKNSRFCRTKFLPDLQKGLSSVSKQVYTTANHEELARAIENVGDSRNLAIAAGDGGLILTLGYYFKQHGDKKINVVYIPTGTHDKEARELGIYSMLAFGSRRDEQRKKFLEDTIKRINHNGDLNWKRRNILKIEYGLGDERKIDYAFDFLIGAVVKPILSWQGLKKEDIDNSNFINSQAKYHAMGMGTTILKTLTQFIADSESVGVSSAKVSLDGKAMGNDYELYSGFFVSTAEMVLPFMKPCYLAGHKTKAHAILTKMHPLEAVKNMPRFMFSKPLDDYPTSIERPVRKVSVEFKRPEVICFAGEFRRADYVNIEVLPNQVNFAVPNYSGRVYLDNIFHKVCGLGVKFGGDWAYRKMFIPSKLNGKK